GGEVAPRACKPERGGERRGVLMEVLVEAGQERVLAVPVLPRRALSQRVVGGVHGEPRELDQPVLLDVRAQLLQEAVGAAAVRVGAVQLGRDVDAQPEPRTIAIAQGMHTRLGGALREQVGQLEWYAPGHAPWT